MTRPYIFICVAFFLAACGGGGQPVVESFTESFTTAKIFGDRAGVARATATNGDQAYIIGPDIVELVYSANLNGDSVASDVSLEDFALAVPGPYYETRLANFDGTEVLSISKNGNFENSDSYLFYLASPNGDHIIMAEISVLKSAPKGDFIYNGLYQVNDRFNDFVEIGDLTLYANFNNKTFGIYADSVSTELTGSGSLNVYSGHLYSGNLSFVEYGVWSAKASLYGAIGGKVASTAAGVWHTNESIPAFEGAFIGHR